MYAYINVFIKNVYKIILYVLIELNIFNPYKDVYIQGIELISNESIIITLSNETIETILLTPELNNNEKRAISYKLPNNKKVNFTVIGQNYNPAKLLITEFCIKGDKKNYDAIELYAVNDGNLDGITICYNNGSYTFDDEYILKDSYRVIAVKEGISSNNGEITIYTSPSLFSSIQDKVIYSNSEMKIFNKNWTGFTLDSTKTTSTKTYNRRVVDNKYVDTNTALDWYISPIRGRTFGKPNIE